MSLFLMHKRKLSKKINNELKNLSDDELKEITTAFSELAQLTFDVYWSKKSGSKNPIRLLKPNKPGDTLTLWN